MSGKDVIGDKGRECRFAPKSCKVVEDLGSKSVDDAVMLLRKCSEGFELSGDLGLGIESDDWWCKSKGRCLVERGIK